MGDKLSFHTVFKVTNVMAKAAASFIVTPLFLTSG
jgi:hypothetical protein